MKSKLTKLLFASTMSALLLIPATEAFAQNSNNRKNKTAEQPAPYVQTVPALADSPDYENVNAEEMVYDPSLLNEEISKKTDTNMQAAREVLEKTHNDQNIPEPPEEIKEAAQKMQGLPGEEFLNNQLEQISELNQIKPGQPMSLKDALLQADKTNIDLEKARINIDTANAQLKQAWALILPNVSASLTYAHLGKVPAMDMGAMTSGMMQPMISVLTQLGIDPATLGIGQDTGEGQKMQMAAPDSVSFELTAGVSLINVAGWFQLKMLDEVTKVTELGIEEGRQQLLAGVAQAYLAALLCGEVVKVQRVQLKSALDQLALAQGRFDRGADVKLSVIQAQFAVEKQRQALIDAIWSYETARDALATLINVDGLPVPQPAKFHGINIESDEELENEAIANNRNLVINRMTQHINELNLNAAIAGFLPTLSGAWVFDYTLTEPKGMTAQKYSWTLALSLSIPIFDYSKFGVIDERKAAIRSTQLEMDSTINATKQKVRKAKREYYSALFAVDNAKRQFELAREAMQLTEAAYANGASTFVDVTNARNNVSAAAIGYVTAGIQSELSLISLLSTLGRDIMEVTY